MAIGITMLTQLLGAFVGSSNGAAQASAAGSCILIIMQVQANSTHQTNMYH